MNMTFLHIGYAKLLVYNPFTQNTMQNQGMLRICCQVWLQISGILPIVFCALFRFTAIATATGTKAPAVLKIFLYDYRLGFCDDPETGILSFYALFSGNHSDSPCSALARLWTNACPAAESGTSLRKITERRVFRLGLFNGQTRIFSSETIGRIEAGTIPTPSPASAR